jgi:hypothetical protein
MERGRRRGPRTPAANACGNACVARHNCPRKRLVAKLNRDRRNAGGRRPSPFLETQHLIRFRSRRYGTRLNVTGYEMDCSCAQCCWVAGINVDPGATRLSIVAPKRLRARSIIRWRQ